MMDRVRARRIHHLGRAAKTALQQMTAKSPVLAETDLVVIEFRLAGDSDIARLRVFSSAWYPHHDGDYLQLFELFGRGFHTYVVTTLLRIIDLPLTIFKRR